MLIGDRWAPEASGGRHEHVNPATGKVQGSVPLAGSKEIDEAVAAARQALPAWRGLPPQLRRDTLLRIVALLRENADELQTMTTLETGMPANLTPFAATQIPCEWFTYYAGWCDKLEGQVVPSTLPGLNYVRHEPYGIVGVILTWNGPLASIGMKVAPALAAGNCVVLKPPELAPFTSLRFAELAVEAGLPPGVLSVVPGGPPAGDALVRHPDVDKISFTGGIGTARKIGAALAETLRPAALELGGKSANIIFADSNLDVAIPSSVFQPLVTVSGQACALGTRLLVEESIYDEVSARAAQMAGGITVGDPFETTTMMGPVISNAACERILGMVDRAVGARSGSLLIGGERLGGELADGFYIAPTVLNDVDSASEIAQEEVFGPVLTILKFRTQEEAIALANDTRYGLAAYLWTENIRRAHLVAQELDAGTVVVNEGFVLEANAPFGGVKGSGYGREGGRPGIEEFLRLKHVAVGLSAGM